MFIKLMYFLWITKLKKTKKYIYSDKGDTVLYFLQKINDLMENSRILIMFLLSICYHITQENPIVHSWENEMGEKQIISYCYSEVVLSSWDPWKSFRNLRAPGTTF